jgi:hypothetical protein
MSDVLKGNFKPKREVKVERSTQPSLEERFEKEALKRLGGSIAFVAKRKVLWEPPDDVRRTEDDRGS